MTRIIDRRLNGKHKSAVNRQRFIRRFKKQIKEAVEKAVSKRGIIDIDQKGETIRISKKDLDEPKFHYDIGGINETIFPGNTDFVKGDRIKRPPQGVADQGSGGASDKGEGEDDFVFEISRKEFLELFFDDLSLPDLLKREMAEIDDFKYIRAGYTKTGTPSNISIIRSMKQAASRRIALGAAYKKHLKIANKKFEELTLTRSSSDKEIVTLKKEIDLLEKKISNIPFIDSVDIRYHNKVKRPHPSTQAVMFCLMDVSGSMDETKKEIAKRFFILLYLFLKRNYEKIHLVFIRHHTSAKEVDEDEFFYSRETGGTVVSSALELMRNIIQERYAPSAWNIYVAQASDGDNWNADSPYCQKLLTESIMPFVQYYAYVEIMPRHHQSLWDAYSSIDEYYSHFSMKHIEGLLDIYPIFRELFKRREG